jgi:hypothetical protein
MADLISRSLKVTGSITAGGSSRFHRNPFAKSFLRNDLGGSAKIDFALGPATYRACVAIGISAVDLGGGSGLCSIGRPIQERSASMPGNARDPQE